jgi:cytosine/adenosine deaminase-related metal-dependent hydrolase
MPDPASSDAVSLEMLALNIKMLGQRTKKNLLISAGKLDDKRRMLPAISAIQAQDIVLYATKGTSQFLIENGIPNHLLHKIAESREPNIRSFLAEDRLDLVINILTGDPDYDEASDSKVIRRLSIENGIPLITDVDVALLTLQQLANRSQRPERKPETWDLRAYFLNAVAAAGGFACYHAHFDKAYLISPDNLKLSMVDMQKKWSLYKYLKENYTREDLLERVSRGVECMIAQGVTHCRSFIDADSTVKLLPLEVAMEVREKYKDRIVLEYAVQPLQGVVDPDSRHWFAEACKRADIVGGLPSKDRPTPEKHLDYILSLARDLGKRVDVHVDQENNPFESETELLALKTIEHGLQGRVSAVHAISLSAKPPIEQDRILRIAQDAGLSFIVCPSAALSMKQLDLNAPIHNSIAPVARVLEHNLTVYLGVDNIADLFMPLVDGSLWFECRVLMEACRFYDVDRIAAIATDTSGFARGRKNLELTTAMAKSA